MQTSGITHDGDYRKMRFNEHIHTWFRKTTTMAQKEWLEHHKEYPNYLENRHE